MNRIVDFLIEDENLTPATAEVWVTVLPQRQDAGTDVRGRLMGPRCAYASTVEVAYPLRPLTPNPSPPLRGRGEEERALPHDAVTRQVVIPEPSFWEPESPFLYEGVVELWQDGTRCDQRTIRHGLRLLTLGSRGLRLNGRPLRLRGCQPPGVCDVRDLRSRGCNIVVAEAAEGLCDAADRLGLFVLAPATTPDRSEVRRLVAHPCFLGWLLTADAARQGVLPAEGLIGVELQQVPAEPLPAGIHFLVVSQESTAAAAALGLPLLVRGAAEEGTAATILGHIAAGT
jgi:hypothetical protein